MGLFFKKKTEEYCPICGKPATYKYAQTIKDNQKLCPECNPKVYMDKSMLPFQSAEDIKKHLTYREENFKLVQKFSPTRGIKCGMVIFREDTQMKKWCCAYGENHLNPPLFDYNELIDYEFTVNDEQIIKGGLGSAVAGGILFGGTGAIVGSNIGKKTSSSIVQSMEFRISLNNKYLTQLTVPFLLKGEVKVGDYTYNTYKREVDNAISFLDSIRAKAAAASASAAQSSTVSSADEILKFKNLLDSGIISQEEFDAKKKQLLGL